jgi:hypothetical protein
MKTALVVVECLVSFSHLQCFSIVHFRDGEISERRLPAGHWMDADFRFEKHQGVDRASSSTRSRIAVG